MQARKNGLGRASRLALASMVLALSACGGGGGGGGNVRTDPPPAAPPPPPPPSPPPSPPVVYPPDPGLSQHLRLTNADAAHQAGLTGAGVRIGVVDSGVNRNHPALYPRVVTNLNYIDPAHNDLRVDDKVGHGTAVAQAMAGTAFGAWPGGVAPGAQIVSARIISDEPPPDDGSGQGNEVDGALGLKPIHQDLIDRGARIMNNSWGGLYWTDPAATAPIADEYRPFIASNGGLVVFATGNEGRADPSSMAALPSQLGPGGSTPAADLERGWIAVTALSAGSSDTIADYANRCGVAMRYCLAAPGTVSVTGTDDASDAPSYWTWSGTSLAAPLVSGAAALVWQAFPYFNNDLVRQTLLGTARDLGEPGIDPVFGHGGLDIGRAINGPAALDWGNVTVSFSGTSTWSNHITGTGGIVKRGSGTLKLTGSNDYTGGTRIEAGTLSTDLPLPGNASVSTGATLDLPGGNGVEGDLVNNGTVAIPGFGGQVRAIGGDYVQGRQGTLSLPVGMWLHVSGAVTLAGTLNINGLFPDYTYQSRENIIVADGGLTGRFDALTTSPGVFLEATLGYDNRYAWLDITRLDVSATAQAMGLGATALSSARRVESAFDAIDAGAPVDDPHGDFASGAGALQRSATAAAAERTLSSLSGAVQGADGLYAGMALEGGRHAVEARVDARERRFAAGGAWADSDTLQRQAAGRLAVDGNGWRLGHDLRVGDGFTVGAAFGQADVLAWFGDGAGRDSGDRDRARLVDGQVYAAWESGDHYLFGRYAYGRIDRRVQRDLLLGDARFGADSDHASRYFALELQAGRRFDLAGLRLTPYAGVQAMRLDRDGFAEDEIVGFGLRAEDSRMRATQAAWGLRFGRDWAFGDARLGLSGRAEWLRTLSQSGADIDARFNAIDVWSPIPGQPLSSEAAVFGIGLDAQLPRAGRWRLGFDHRSEAGRDWMQTRLDWRFGF